jgi:hypothetical protein
VIAEKDLVAVNAEREAFIETRGQEVDLPLRFTVVYQDLERDADIGTQYAKRVQLEASLSPGPDDRRPRRIVHDPTQSALPIICSIAC